MRGKRILGCLLLLILCWMPVASAMAGESPMGARLVLVRTNSFTAALWPMVLRIDHRRVATLYRGAYTIVEVEPGTRTLRMYCAQQCAMRTLKFDVAFAPGETQYWLIDPEFQKKKDTRILISRIRRITPEEFQAMAPAPQQVAPD